MKAIPAYTPTLVKTSESAANTSQNIDQDIPSASYLALAAKVRRFLRPAPTGGREVSSSSMSNPFVLLCSGEPDLMEPARERAAGECSPTEGAGESAVVGSPVCRSRKEGTVRKGAVGG
jgi:hypothetical protein